jgi:hypothetical protein
MTATPPRSRPTKKSRVRFTLRLAVYRQSVRLGVKPLEDYDRTTSRLFSLYNFVTDCIENAALSSDDPAVPLLLGVHSLSLRGVYRGCLLGLFFRLSCHATMYKSTRVPFLKMALSSQTTGTIRFII